jgi:hypothetical protein
MQLYAELTHTPLSADILRSEKALRRPWTPRVPRASDATWRSLSANRHVHLRLDSALRNSLDRSQHWRCHLRHRSHHRLPMRPGLRGGCLHAIRCLSQWSGGFCPNTGWLQFSTFRTGNVQESRVGVGKQFAGFHLYRFGNSGADSALEIRASSAGEEYILRRIDIVRQ